MISAWSAFRSIQTAVAGLPVITTSPQGQTVLAGQSVVFGVTAAGDAPLTYQWRLNGQRVFGATNFTVAVTNIQPAQAGEYSVEVSNPVGLTISPEARLTLATQFAAAFMQTNGQLQFRLIGELGRNSQVQTSADLVTWTTRFELFNDTGTIEFTDPEAGNSTRRFYRAVTP